MEKFDFLYKEYEMLIKKRQEVSDLQEKRLSSYSIIIGFSIAFIGYLMQNTDKLSIYPALIPIALVTIGVTIIPVGLITFKRVIIRQNQSDNYLNELKQLQEHLRPQLKLDIVESGFLDNILDFDKGVGQKYLSIAMIVSLLNSLIITIYISAFTRIIIFKDTKCEPPKNELSNESIALIMMAFFVYLLTLGIHYYSINQMKSSKK